MPNKPGGDTKVIPKVTKRQLDDSEKAALMRRLLASEKALKATFAKAAFADDIEDLEDLCDFADAGARDAPPVFVGRLDVIADIKRQAELTATRAAGSAANDNAGRTRLVFGASGAGKTALLRQLEQLNAESDQASVFLRLGVKDLASREALAQALVSGLPKSALAALSQSVARLLLNIVPGVPGHGDSILDSAGDVFTPTHGPSAPTPIVVMVDEVQTVEPRTLEARALYSLHADPHPGLAVLPVFAGLGNLPAHRA